MKRNLKSAIKIALLGGAVLMATTATAYDKELLDILLGNGSINQAQYDGLAGKAEKKGEIIKKMAWAGKIKIKGDVRVRQEFQTEDSGIGSGDGEDRQRYRARIGIYADVAESVKVGIRLVSAGGATSTNETLGDGFKNDAVYFDLAYINWQPLEGLEVIAGKFKQPWEQVSGGLVWDSDVNPEGVTLRYTTKLGGVKVIASAGHLVLDDIDGYSFDEDNTIGFGQLATKFKLGGAKVLLGVSVYDYDENKVNGMISGSGNDATKYSIQELFGSIFVKVAIPLKVYGHYAKNDDADGANSEEDTAWLLGVGTKVGKWKFSYDYRETELNAVNGAFNDSDFAGGRTDSDGSRIKASYKISKNFSVGTAYFKTEVGKLNGYFDVDIWQIDLKAKF